MGTNRTIKRQEERQQQKSSIVYRYTPEQLKAELSRQVKEVHEKYLKEEAQIRKEAAKEVVDMMLAVFALAMHDEMGFGYKRAGRVLERVKTSFNCIKSKHLSYQDILDELKRIKIHF